MGKRKNLTGCRFGRLTVIRYTGERVDGNAVWECVCDCGGVKKTTAKNLLSGGTKSCGCLQKEKASKVARTINDRLMQSKETEHPSYKHGESRTRLYGIWLHMNDRCRNKNNTAYSHYGGRGISVCEEWSNSYETFRDWALANGYDDSLSIDRIDPNGNYTPGNCRWATKSQQSSNRRRYARRERYVRVMCIETGNIYESIKDAAQDTGVEKTSISKCIHGVTKRAGGFRWQICKKDSE